MDDGLSLPEFAAAGVEFVVVEAEELMAATPLDRCTAGIGRDRLGRDGEREGRFYRIYENIYWLWITSRL